MATHGEKRWPPAGRFNGRLRGAFHGHRQRDSALLLPLPLRRLSGSIRQTAARVRADQAQAAGRRTWTPIRLEFRDWSSLLMGYLPGAGSQKQSGWRDCRTPPEPARGRIWRRPSESSSGAARCSGHENVQGCDAMRCSCQGDAQITYAVRLGLPTFWFELPFLMRISQPEGALLVMIGKLATRSRKPY